MTVLVGHEVLFVPEQFPTIQLAVDAVRGPATIMLFPGLYPENVTVVDKPYLVIQSTGLSRRGVAIAGDGSGLVVLSVAGSSLHLSGIEIRSNARLRGIMVDRASINLQDCFVGGNRTGSAGAGVLARNSNLHLQRSSVIGNTVESEATVAGGGGLYLQDCRVQIAGCTIQGNAVYAIQESQGGGIWSERTSMRLWRSRITDNALYGSSCAGAGIYLNNALSSQLGGSVITGNSCQSGRGGGICVAGDASQVRVHRNTVVRQNHPTDLEFA